MNLDSGNAISVPDTSRVDGDAPAAPITDARRRTPRRAGPEEGAADAVMAIAAYILTARPSGAALAILEDAERVLERAMDADG